ncbi:MAG: UDP-N-acetylmuramoyl-tripeptide--D-alanyl-D-alanine ligase [Egibacteraceae bacterium]
MIPLSLAQLAEVVGGSEPCEPPDDAQVTSVVIDSRRVRPGALFVPLPGEHVDGHDYVTASLEQGAAGYLWAQDRGLAPDPGRAVIVDDPADALLGLGWWLRDEVDPVVVAVTGSVGKTTTKDLIAAAVGAGARTVAGEGSHNNELGVPLTCARLQMDTEVLVVEIGARGLGHIAQLAGPLRPDIAVVTAVGASHLEMLGDIETVARAKAELVQVLSAEGLAVLNVDDQRVAAMARQAPGEVLGYGEKEGADWQAVSVRHDALARHRFTVRHPAEADRERPQSQDELEVELSIPGRHNVGNALAALAVAARCGVELRVAASALATAAVSAWRMEILSSPHGVTVLNDAYNANPESMRAALATLASL